MQDAPRTGHKYEFANKKLCPSNFPAATCRILIVASYQFLKSQSQLICADAMPLLNLIESRESR